MKKPKKKKKRKPTQPHIIYPHFYPEQMDSATHIFHLPIYNLQLHILHMFLNIFSNNFHPYLL